MNDNISLARHWKNGKRIDITIKDYKEMLELKDKNKAKTKISNMIYHRFYGRYIKTFEWGDDVYKEEYKSGFAMMTSSCLLIEALESFYNGWGNTKNKSELAFCKFFDRVSELSEFHGYSSEFYKNIRCGILHQAEATGGFKIHREGLLFDKDNKTINAYKFIKRIEKSLQSYIDDLIKKDWNSLIWINCRKKMKNIIKNCETI